MLKNIFLALFLTVFAWTGSAHADDKFKNLSIAVVDVQSLLRDSKAAKDIETQATSIRKNFQAEIAKEQAALRESEKAVLAERGKLKEEEFRKKAENFQKSVNDTEKRVSERRAKLDKALAEALNKLRGKIVEVTATVGEANDIDLVVSRAEVVIVNKGLDITPQVMEKLNEALPSVKVDLP